MVKFDWMISYQWSGVDEKERFKNMKKFMNFFKSKNKKIFCFGEWSPEFSLNADENYRFCLNAQKNTEKILFFINYKQESKGMLYELDLAKKEKQKAILLIKKEFLDLDWVQPFKDFVEKEFVFDNFDKINLEKIYEEYKI